MLFMHIFTNPFLLQIKCPLGLLFLNPNKASEILEDIQTKYVPTHNGNETDAEIIQRIFFFMETSSQKNGQGIASGQTP